MIIKWILNLKEAEILYKQVLTRAHEKEFGAIDGESALIYSIQ